MSKTKTKARKDRLSSALLNAFLPLALAELLEEKGIVTKEELSKAMAKMLLRKIGTKKKGGNNEDVKD